MGKLVSILIPTLNSERTLARCIDSVKRQTYKNIEIIVVDSFSKDSTIDIAKRYGCRVIRTKWKLLGARFIGTQKARGKFVLMLDSDQELRGNSVISRAVDLMKRYDMLILEESSYGKRLLDKMADADRQLRHHLEIQKDPVEGTLLPRFFRKEVLVRAFRSMDMGSLHDVVIFDHAIIYYEACKVSDRVGMLKDAAWHFEPQGLLEIFEHNYRYGATARKFEGMERYRDLIKKKVRPRKGTLAADNGSLAIQSAALLMFKGIAYGLGYLTGRE